MEYRVEFGGVPPPPGCIYEGTLTKKMLMSLPEGSILLGNGFNMDWTPGLIRVLPPVGQMELAAGNVVNIDGTKRVTASAKPITSREAMWIGIKRSRWNGLKCYAFKDRNSAKNWVESIGRRFPIVAARG